MGCYYMTMSLPGRKGEGMIFSSLDEVQLAYSLGKVETHARIKVKLPPDRRLKSEAPQQIEAGRLIETTVGRVIFNQMLPEGMPFYNIPMRSSELGQRDLRLLPDPGPPRDDRPAGRHEPDRLPREHPQRSVVRHRRPDHAGQQVEDHRRGRKEVLKKHKLYQRGIITDMERYNQVLDAWTHARERITTEMMTELENDFRTGGYVNPIFLMAHSGARGGVEQIRQLAGMRGLMAKPSGKIIETPIKANFREGLTVLEYFSQHARRPQGSGRYGPQDGRLGLPDPQAGRRGAKRRDHAARLRHDARHHQGRHLPRRKGRSQPGRLDPRPRQPHEHRQSDHRRNRGPRERTDHANHRPPDRGARPGADSGPQPADLRRGAGRLPPVLRHGPLDRLDGRRGHGRRHHRRPEHRRAGHAVDDAHVPHRRRRSARRGRKREQGQEGRHRPVHPAQGRAQRRRTKRRAHPQRRNRDPRSQGARAGEVRSARRRRS